MKRSVLLFSLFIVSIVISVALTGCTSAKPPVASIASPADNQGVKIGTPVAFKGVAKDDKGDKGKEIKDAKYEWDFGDGSPKDTAQNPTHAYKQPKAYKVTLTVRGPKEAATSQVKADSTQITQINIKVEDTAPTASATATPTSGDAPLSVKFDGSASKDADPGDSITKYEWDFGDGSPKGTGATVTHQYAAPKDYKAMLTVTDSFNMTGTTTLTVSVKAPSTALGKVWEIKMGTADGKNVFDPPVVTVQPGDTIRWVNNGAHTATAYCPKNGKKLGIPAAAADTPLCFDSKMLVNPGQTYELRIPADAPQGTYAYYCLPHEPAGMVGLIVVGKPSDLSKDFIDSLAAPVKTAIQNLLKMIK